MLRFKNMLWRTSLVVKWLRLHAPNAGGIGSIPGQERCHVAQPKTMYANNTHFFLLPP